MRVYEIRHLTRYRYRGPVRFGDHRMMLRPLESFDQRVLSFDLEISPTPRSIRFGHDVLGNTVGHAAFDLPGEDLTFHSKVVVERRAPLRPDRWEVDATLPAAYDPDDLPDLVRSMERRDADPDGAVDRFARRFLSPRGQTSIVGLLEDMTAAIHSEFRYATRLEGGAQAPAETLQRRVGSCRDFAVLMIDAARSLGLAAQFVSGYIYAPAVSHGPLTRVGGGHTHAWLRVYVPRCGWVEFDPTNGLVANPDLLRVAATRDPSQASPLSGVFHGAGTAFLGLEVEVDVTRLDHQETDLASGARAHLHLSDAPPPRRAGAAR